MDPIGKPPIPVIFLITGKIAMVCCWFFFLIKIINEDSLLFHSRVAQAIGFVMYIAGFIIIILGILHLGKSIAVGLSREKTELKTHGIFRLTRNPVYSGAYIVCAGSCMVFPNAVNFILFALTIIIHHSIILREEKYLENKFGEQWLKYKERVPRYFVK